MAIQFDPTAPFEVVEGETLDTLTAPRVRAPLAPPIGPVFDPAKPFTPVADAPAGPVFDPTAPVQKVYGVEEFSAKPVDELIADKDFMPVQFGVQHENDLTDPALRTKLEQVYAARERSGTSLTDKAKAFGTGIAPAVKTLAEGVKSAAKLAQKFTPAGIAKRIIEGTPQEVINDYAKSGTEAAASVELAALGSTDLIRRSTRAVGEAVGMLPGDLPAVAAASGVPVRRSKADMTEGDWRNRLSDDIAAAKQVEVAGQGNGVVMESLGIDAATLERDHGIKVDPEEIARLSVVTDPINYIPFGAGVGAVTKIGGKAVRLGIAATQTAEQATKLANILNSATTAARSVTGQVAGTAAKAVGGAIESVGNVAEKGVRALGGTASGVGLGGILGGNVYSALGGAAVAKGVPRVAQVAGRAIKGTGKILTGEAAAPAALTLATDTLKATAAGGVKGALEGGALILPFEIGARPEEEEQLLGMVGLGSVIRGGAEGARPVARAAGRGAQNQLAKTIFKTKNQVEQLPLAESPTYGTDPLLDSNHSANSAKLSVPEQKLVNWGREFLRDSGGEVYVLDNAAFNRETGSKTARGYAVSIGEKIAPDGTATPVFRILLNQSAEALPHEFFHALTDLDPKRAADFRETVQKSLTPSQLSSFEQLYNTRLNDGLPQAEWKRRLTPEQVANEVTAETFSRLFLSQDLTGVAPAVQQKAALFISSLLEKAGAPLAATGRRAGEAGVSSLGVRPGVESTKAGQAWLANMLQRVNDEGTLGQPPILPERAEQQTPIPTTLVSRKPARTTPAAPAPVPVPSPRPTPVNPPLPSPAAPAPTARNIRTPKARQDDFAGRRAEVTNIDPATAAAEATGDANTIARVKEISDLIESGSPVVEIEHSGVKSASTAEAPSGRSARRAEQEAAYIAEGRAAAPEAIREAYQKVFVPVRWEIVGGKPQLLAMSLDKVIANTHKAVKESAARGVEARIPYEITDGKLTDNAWGQFVDDLKAYADNQANGFRGDGQKLIRPTEDVGLSIPAENPAYNPRPITEERANFLNMVQGLNPPLTARTSSAVLPGNVKGQVLAEVNTRQPQVPSVIRPEDITKQDFKSVPGRRIAETNPLRNELAAAGVPVRELIEVTERINAADINSVKARPELDFKAPVTDTIRGGFLPDSGFSDASDPIVKAAVKDADGNIYVGDFHSSIIAENGLRFTDERIVDGFVTRSGKFFDRDEALEHAQEINQLRPGSDSAELGYLEADTFNRDLTRQRIDDFRAKGSQLPGDVVTSEVISEVLKMDATAFNAAAKSWDGGQRNRAYDLGLSTKSPEEVQLLRDAQESASADRKKFMAARDIDNGVASALKAQFFREAYEAATDTGGAAGEIGWRQAFPDRVAPFPEPKGEFLPGEISKPDVKRLEADLDLNFTGTKIKFRGGKYEVQVRPRALEEFQVAAAEHGLRFVSDNPDREILAGGFDYGFLVRDPEAKPVGEFLPSADELDKVKSGQKDGETFNRDGTIFSPGDRKLDVVTLASENLPASELSPDRVKAFLSKYPALLESDSVKPGIFRLANGDVSIDLNVVVDQTHRKNTEAFARANNQQAIFDLVNFENVETGGNGQTVLKTPEAIADAAKKLERGEPVTVSGEPSGDFLPTGREWEATMAKRRAAGKTEEPKKAAGKLTPATWILPDGEVKSVTTTYHEQDLATNSADYNKRFGTGFSKDATIDDRVEALNKGFVRVRYSPENGRTAVEVGAAHWNKQKAKVLDTLLSSAEKVDKLVISLLNETGESLDTVSASVFNADDRAAAITDAVNEIVPPTTQRAKNIAPTDIQRMRALPGPGDFLPASESDISIQPEDIKSQIARATKEFPDALVIAFRPKKGDIQKRK